MKRWIALLAVLFSIVLVGSGTPPPCWGTSLISFTDTSPSTTAWVNFGVIAAGVPPPLVAAAASWTQTVGTTNTTIGAVLSGIDEYYGEGWAYLMNDLGPGTTTANEIAKAYFTVPIVSDIMDLNSAPVTTLFTGLSLDPGTYYLVLEMTQNRLFWLGDYTGVVVNTATGFTVGSFQDTFNAANYPPSSDFSTCDDGFGNLITLFFSVDSTPVPAPATILLLGSGLLGLGAWRRLRKS